MRYEVLRLPLPLPANPSYGNKLLPFLRHPIYGWAGLRPALAQHTAAEHDALMRWAAGRSALLEIGVAEGVSALALREAMTENGTLYLIDPFHLSRIPAFNFMKRVARRVVESCPRGKAVWIEQFSQDAAQTWRDPLDLILIDADHSEAAVERDWSDWNRFVKPGGAVIFHDARIFEGGWTRPELGPVKVVNRYFRDGGPPEWTIAEEIHSLVVVKRHKQAAARVQGGSGTQDDQSRD